MSNPNTPATPAKDNPYTLTGTCEHDGKKIVVRVTQKQLATTAASDTANELANAFVETLHILGGDYQSPDYTVEMLDPITGDVQAFIKTDGEEILWQAPGGVIQRTLDKSWVNTIEDKLFSLFPREKLNGTFTEKKALTAEEVFGVKKDLDFLLEGLAATVAEQKEKQHLETGEFTRNGKTYKYEQLGGLVLLADEKGVDQSNVLLKKVSDGSQQTVSIELAPPSSDEGSFVVKTSDDNAITIGLKDHPMVKLEAAGIGLQLKKTYQKIADDQKFDPRTEGAPLLLALMSADVADDPNVATARISEMLTTFVEKHNGVGLSEQSIKDLVKQKKALKEAAEENLGTLDSPAVPQQQRTLGPKGIPFDY